MKKQSNLSKLLGYAGNYKILTYLSWIFSALSAFVALVPFWYIWKILKEVIEVAPDFKLATHITHYGWMAVLFAILSVIIYIVALMCSHLSAFRIATNLRISMIHHISTQPLGFAIMTKMTGRSMQEKMTEYQNALADMSNEAVEYVRGIPVIKTFGQTLFSFKKFKKTIDNYEKWTIE